MFQDRTVANKPSRVNIYSKWSLTSENAKKNQRNTISYASPQCCVSLLILNLWCPSPTGAKSSKYPDFLSFHLNWDGFSPVTSFFLSDIVISSSPILFWTCEIDQKIWESICSKRPRMQHENLSHYVIVPVSIYVVIASCLLSWGLVKKAEERSLKTRHCIFTPCFPWSMSNHAKLPENENWDSKWWLLS